MLCTAFKRLSGMREQKSYGLHEYQYSPTVSVQKISALRGDFVYLTTQGIRP